MWFNSLRERGKRKREERRGKREEERGREEGRKEGKRETKIQHQAWTGRNARCLFCNIGLCIFTCGDQDITFLARRVSYIPAWLALLNGFYFFALPLFRLSFTKKKEKRNQVLLFFRILAMLDLRHCRKTFWFRDPPSTDGKGLRANLFHIYVDRHLLNKDRSKTTPFGWILFCTSFNPMILGDWFLFLLCSFDSTRFHYLFSGKGRACLLNCHFFSKAFPSKKTSFKTHWLLLFPFLLFLFLSLSFFSSSAQSSPCNFSSNLG